MLHLSILHPIAHCLWTDNYVLLAAAGVAGGIDSDFENDAISNAQQHQLKKLDDLPIDHVERFHAELAMAFVDADFLPLVIQIVNSTAQTVNSTFGGKGGAYESSQKSKITVQVLTAGGSILGFLARRSVHDLTIRRHLQLHGRQFVTQVITNVLEFLWKEQHQNQASAPSVAIMHCNSIVLVEIAIQSCSASQLEFVMRIYLNK